MSYSAKLIETSVNRDGQVLVTMELEYPRMIHSEFMTHRMFSRNASSNRAIPTEKLLQMVQDDTAYPVYWGENMKGMKAKVEIKNLIDGLDPMRAWKVNAVEACKRALMWAKAGYHKQIVNRIVEPYQHIKVIVTATEWYNFFDLRCHPDAQPEIKYIADMMKYQYCNHTSNISKWNSIREPLKEWHLPYVTLEERESLDINTLIKCSVARCARVSYLTHDNQQPKIEDDIKLYTRLAEAKHMSPFEHQATCFPEDMSLGRYGSGVTHQDIYGNFWSGNFKGFAQYRQIKEHHDLKARRAKANIGFNLGEM